MIIADTGFWVALSDADDQFHTRASELLKELREPLITTVEVLTEASHILLKRAGFLVMLRFLNAIDQGLAEIVAPSAEGLSKQLRLMQKYHSLPMDLADASLVILAEKLGHGRILSTDQRDFKTYRWKEKKPFTNLLSEHK